MNKRGFTLIELLVVLAIVSIASAGSILIFDRADAENNIKKTKETYVRIQRAAKIYLDMNDSWRNQFNEKNYMFLKINELQNENFIKKGLVDETDFSEINSSYLILVYYDEESEIVDSCIVSSSTSPRCIANSEGEKCDCCLHYLTNGGGENNPYCK